MRFLLELKLQKNELPKDYHKLFMSFFKNALSKCNNGKYFEDFYKDTNQKDFCFSVMFGKCKFTKEKIILDGNKIKMLVSANESSKNKFILFNAFLGQKNTVFPLPNENKMTLVSVIQLKGVEIKNSKVIFKTALGSGICVRKHNKETNKDEYFVYNDNNFEENLRRVLKMQAVNAGFSEKIADNIRFKAIQCRKIVTQHYGIFIDTTVGMFELEADSKLLQYFYDTGFGSRTSETYGVLELVTQDLL